MKRSSIKKSLMAFAVVLLMTACSVTPDKLAKEVKNHMNQTWSEQGVDLKCTTLSLVKESGNTYHGIATLSSDGETEDVSVKVICDGSQFQWEIEY